MSVENSMRATVPPEAEPTEIQPESWWVYVVTVIFVFTPILALVVALPLALSGTLPLTWLDLGLALFFYAFTAMGITIGFHRYYTHGGFKASKPVQWVLAVSGSMAIEGGIVDWVADHRKHHKFSDAPGDPHSPWRFGTDTRAVAKGLYYAHMGWFFDVDGTEPKKYAPDLLKDPIASRTNRLFPALVALTLILPAVLGGLLTWSWMGALSAFFWAGLVRIALVHQVTWSINSICHVWPKRPFKSRDLSSNVAWLAVPSFGESWHSYHHADPTAARHGVLARQVDMSATVIRLLEKTGHVQDVRWPTEKRVRGKFQDPAEAATAKVHRTLRVSKEQTQPIQ